MSGLSRDTLRELTLVGKRCFIINGYANWQLWVDGRNITFEDSDAVDYFKDHYASLGYDVDVIKTPTKYAHGGSGDGA